MKSAVLIITAVGAMTCGCRMYRSAPDKLIAHEVKLLKSTTEDTLVDFSIDQPLRAAVTGAKKNSGCIYLGYAPRIKRNQVNLPATKRLFAEYNKQERLPKSTQFATLPQKGDTLHLENESVSHITVDDNIYRFNDFNFAVAEFRRVLKSDGKLVLRIMEFRKAVLNHKQQSAMKGKPEGTTEAIKQYFEKRGFKLLQMHKIVLDRPSARASKQKELVFLFTKA